MQEAITALAQWEMVQANDTTLPSALPPATPDVQADGARLSELLATPDGVGVYALEPVTAAQEPGAGTRVMGELILAKLDAIGAEYKTNVNHAYDILEKAPNEVTLHEMMKLQLEMAVVSLEIEVVGKGVQKAVQHADTLAKLQ